MAWPALFKAMTDKDIVDAPTWNQVESSQMTCPSPSLESLVVMSLRTLADVIKIKGLKLSFFGLQVALNPVPGPLLTDRKQTHRDLGEKAVWRQRQASRWPCCKLHDTRYQQKLKEKGQDPLGHCRKLCLLMSIGVAAGVLGTWPERWLESPSAWLQ